MSFTASARSTACASLSMTHGPAMSTSAPPPRLTPPHSTGITRLPYHGRRRVRARRQLVPVAGHDESGEQRVRLERLRLELGVKLDGDVVRMIRQLDHLDEFSVERSADDLQAALGQRLLVEAVELVAVPVALVDDV